MLKKIDARGLSCPQPVLMTLKGMELLEKGEIVVLVDNDTAKENVARAVASKGWSMKQIQTEGKDYHLTISKE
jgi:Predicted redox protein, regulator of disulfide bond formation